MSKLYITMTNVDTGAKCTIVVGGGINAAQFVADAEASGFKRDSDVALARAEEAQKAAADLEAKSVDLFAAGKDVDGEKALADAAAAAEASSAFLDEAARLRLAEEEALDA